MPTLSHNSLNNLLQICVYDTVHVVDVFGAVAKAVKKVVSVVAYTVAEFVGKIIQNRILFANLNNHSSPPHVTMFGLFQDSDYEIARD